MMNGRRIVFSSVLAATLFLGGRMALAASPPTSPPSPAGLTWFVDKVASELGVTPTRLEDAVKAAAVARVKRLEQQGRISSGQAQRMEEAIQSGRIFGWLMHRFCHRHGLYGTALRAAGAFLGMRPTELRARIRQGQSLATLAESQGKSVQDLEQAILNAWKTRLERAVQAGRLSARREAAMLQRLDRRVQALVERTWTKPSAGNAAGSGNAMNG